MVHEFLKSFALSLMMHFKRESWCWSIKFIESSIVFFRSSSTVSKVHVSLASSRLFSDMDKAILLSLLVICPMLLESPSLSVLNIFF